MIQDLLRLCSDPPGSVNPKLQALKDYLSGETLYERVVVYCWYRSTARLLMEAIGKRCVGVITGDTSLQQRDRVLERFEGIENAVMVANIAAAGSGLNFQAASRCVFIEESELPAENDQAIGRLKRRGQKEVVRVHRFITDGLESSKHRRIDKRETNIRQALLEEFLKEET
jgi:SNF2 family DNA or RNA helicase